MEVFCIVKNGFTVFFDQFKSIHLCVCDLYIWQLEKVQIPLSSFKPYIYVLLKECICSILYPYNLISLLKITKYSFDLL